MARGQQKIQSQQKAQEKAKKLAKAGGPDQKKAAQAALTWQCSVCKCWEATVAAVVVAKVVTATEMVVAVI